MHIVLTLSLRGFGEKGLSLVHVNQFHSFLAHSYSFWGKFRRVQLKEKHFLFLCRMVLNLTIAKNRKISIFFF